MYLLPQLQWLFKSSAILLLATGHVSTALPSPNPQPTDSPNPPSLKPVTLPAPTGPHTIGTTSLILTDSSRLETLSPNPNTTFRVIVAQLYYPTLPSLKLDKYKRSLYLTPGLAKYTEQSFMLPPGIFDLITTNSYVDAPVVLPNGQDKPADVVIFSPGYGASKQYYQTYHEELASQGYIVIAIEHLYDTEYVDIPGLGEFRNKYINESLVGHHHSAPPMEEIPEMHAVRLQDGVFILKSLAEENSELVKGLERLFEKKSGQCGEKNAGEDKQGKSWWGKNARVAIYGHSLGGSTAAGVMLVNPTKTKLLGGINLEGAFQDPATSSTRTIKSPFLLWGYPGHSSATDETWRFFLDKVAKGWKEELSLLGAAHLTFTDYAPLAEIFGLRHMSPAAALELDQLLGTIGGVRALNIVREVVGAFMEWVVKGQKKGKELLEGDFKELPEVVKVGAN